MILGTGTFPWGLKSTVCYTECHQTKLIDTVVETSQLTVDNSDAIKFTVH